MWGECMGFGECGVSGGVWEVWDGRGWGIPCPTRAAQHSPPRSQPHPAPETSPSTPPPVRGFGVWGLRFRVQGLGFGIWDLGSGVWS